MPKPRVRDDGWLAGVDEETREDPWTTLIASGVVIVVMIGGALIAWSFEGAREEIMSHQLTWAIGGLFALGFLAVLIGKVLVAARVIFAQRRRRSQRDDGNAAPQSRLD